MWDKVIFALLFGVVLFGLWALNFTDPPLKHVGAIIFIAALMASPLWFIYIFWTRKRNKEK